MTGADALSPQDLELGFRVLGCEIPQDCRGDFGGYGTVGQVLVALAYGVLDDGECFDGKRPFGNSGWQWDLYRILSDAGIATQETAGQGEHDERARLFRLGCRAMMELVVRTSY